MALPPASNGQGGVSWSIKCKLSEGKKVWHQAGEHLQSSKMKTREEVFIIPGVCRCCWGEGDWRWRYWGGQISYQRQGEDKGGSLKLNQSAIIIDNYTTVRYLNVELNPRSVLETTFRERELPEHIFGKYTFIPVSIKNNYFRPLLCLLCERNIMKTKKCIKWNKSWLNRVSFSFETFWFLSDVNILIHKNINCDE